jgi:hypothetical protein
MPDAFTHRVQANLRFTNHLTWLQYSENVRLWFTEILLVLVAHWVLVCHATIVGTINSEGTASPSILCIHFSPLIDIPTRSAYSNFEWNFNTRQAWSWARRSRSWARRSRTKRISESDSRYPCFSGTWS